MTSSPWRLLIAASGTGGHLFPALGVAQQLPEVEIEWLGVPDRLEQTLVPQDYRLHLVAVEGFQTRLGLKTLKVLWGLIRAIFQVKGLLKNRRIDLVFTTGGYIAAPAILAAKWSGIPVILHESNYIPGKVTRFLSRFCDTVAIGFEGTAQYLPKVATRWVGTPVRSQFYSSATLTDLAIPEDAPLIVVAGGSQGAVAVNRLVRQAATAWLEAGAYIVHLTGENDPDAQNLTHPHYFALPFYENMAGLLQRADLAVSRSGAGTLTELAIAQTPSLLIPYPFAAEDHQTYNAKVFAEAGAAYLYDQKQLTAEILSRQVLDLLNDGDRLQQLGQQAASLAIRDSADRLAELLRQTVAQSQTVAQKTKNFDA
jgi:UDP-N-acetylglucosamine--N-acetylmuramyl-(pentapeptide) pyrophosphoryl-undecaprenol N-acetylglucosamine transferase